MKRDEHQARWRKVTVEFQTPKGSYKDIAYITDPAPRASWWALHRDGFRKNALRLTVGIGATCAAAGGLKMLADEWQKTEILNANLHSKSNNGLYCIGFSLAQVMSDDVLDATIDGHALARDYNSRCSGRAAPKP